jgi:hypothetical protein
VTARPVFGDFADAVSAQLEDALGPERPVARRKLAAARAGQVQEFSRGLAGCLEVMARYTADITMMFDDLTAQQRRALYGEWAWAWFQARHAILNAAAFVSWARSGTGASAGRRARGQAATGLDAAAFSLTIGRDLLQTHFAAGPLGARLDRSEWAPVVTSRPVTRALLFEVAQWARAIAPQGARLALSGAPVQRGTEQQRRWLNAACQWLWVIDSAVQVAERRDSVLTADISLLHAIPLHELAPRLIPIGGEDVARLCQGTTSCAERVRHAARTVGADASWSPAFTAESLIHSASCATISSHNCEILLRSLAARAAEHGVPDVSTRLLSSADAAAVARDSWLQAARGWHRVTTDTRGTISPFAAETADLALWTGRLAHDDPQWTLTTAPSQAVRSPQSLASGPGDLPRVVAAVHQACETLPGIAGADSSQIHTAARAGRLLVPTRSLPDTFDVPHPFAPAPGSRVDILLGAYRDAWTASTELTTTVAAVAADVRAPSRILTAAREAVQAGFVPEVARARRRREPVAASRPVPPGPVERILKDLGVRDLDVLLRASAVDQAGDQMILDVAHDRLGRYGGSAPYRDLNRSASAAEVINHLLASGDPSAVAILHPPRPSRARRLLRPDSDRAAVSPRHAERQSARQEPEAEAEP